MPQDATSVPAKDEGRHVASTDHEGVGPIEHSGCGAGARTSFPESRQVSLGQHQ